MVVVSELFMPLYYNLKNNISAEKLVKDIQSMVTSAAQNNKSEDLILHIEIRTVTNNDHSLIPKLEYKNTDLTN